MKLPLSLPASTRSLPARLRGRRRSRGKRRPRRSWPQRFVIAAGVLSTLAFVGSAAGIGYIYSKAGTIPRVELSGVLADQASSGVPRNVLLVGIDSTEGLDEDDPIFNERDHSVPLSDTIMILRVDPNEKDADLLSVPRDLWVTFPETQAQGRINSSLWRGDGRPDVLIDLLGSYLGIPIHHYVEVNFAGFKELVDSVGGVPVHFEYPARDRYSGLHVYEDGCVTLDGSTALAYARARFYDNYIDGRWQRETGSDLARIERQQDLIRRTADRAISRGARNPGTLNGMLNSALKSVTVDDQLTPADILDLAEKFRSFDPHALKSHVLPTEDDTVGAAQIQRLVEHEAEPVLEIFRDQPEPVPPGDDGPELDPGSPDSPSPGTGSEPNADDTSPPPDDGLEPADVLLTVLNGSGQSGQASEAGAQLAEAGFGIIGRDNASQYGLQRTEVRYPSGSEAEAAMVERWLVSGAELVESSEVAGVTVVTGADWEGARSQPGVAEPSSERRAGAAGSGSTRTTSDTSTTSVTSPSASTSGEVTTTLPEESSTPTPRC